PAFFPPMHVGDAESRRKLMTTLFHAVSVMSVLTNDSGNGSSATFSSFVQGLRSVVFSECL
ncbi:hypothetical protein P7K49_014943, partial [Saguinus oedipus]